MSEQDYNAHSARVRATKDPIEAFNLFISYHLPDLYSHFIDSDDNEAEFIRRTIHSYASEARIDELKRLDFDDVSHRQSKLVISFGEVEDRVAELEGES